MFSFGETGESRRLNPLRTKSPKRKCLMTFENEKKVEKKLLHSGGECLNLGVGKEVERRNPVNFILIVNTAMRA